MTECILATIYSNTRISPDPKPSSTNLATNQKLNLSLERIYAPGLRGAQAQSDPGSSGLTPVNNISLILTNYNSQQIHWFNQLKWIYAYMYRVNKKSTKSHIFRAFIWKTASIERA